jgi:hypothetical protein
MNKYEGKTLTNATFVVEESFFINCVLRDCDLFYSGGDYDWMNARFENCRWHFRGPALKTMQMMQQIGMVQPQVLPPSPASGSKMN